LIALILQPIITRMTQLTMPVPLVSHRSPDTGLISPSWRLSRGVAVLLVYLVLIAVLVFLLVSLVPVLGPQLLSLQTTLPDAVTTIPGWATDLEAQFNQLGLHINLEQVIQPAA